METDKAIEVLSSLLANAIDNLDFAISDDNKESIEFYDNDVKALKYAIKKLEVE